MQHEFEFAPIGAALWPRPSKLALDVGSRLEPGVIDHHCHGMDDECAASLVVARPDLVTGHLGRAPAHVTYVVHREPDLDCVAAAYLADLLVREGRLPDCAQVIADYVRQTDAGRVPPDGMGPNSIWSLFYAAVEVCNRSLPHELGEDARFSAWMKRGFALMNLVVASGGGLPADGAGLEDWAEERALVIDDGARYARDLERARRIELDLPCITGGTERVRGLIIENPESLLFKHRARAEGFRFLHVQYRSPTQKSVRHVISVAREGQTWLLGLGALLEGREDLERQRLHCYRSGKPRWPDVSSNDPWYDGRSPLHGYTIVDSPRAGTVLEPAEVERLVSATKEWIQLGRTRGVRVCPVGCRFAANESSEYCPHHGRALMPLVVDGRYMILRPLGQGGMGSVFEVQELATGQHQALKVVSRNFLGQPELMARFAREARLLSSVDHEMLMRYEGFGADQSTGVADRSIPPDSVDCRVDTIIAAA